MWGGGEMNGYKPHYTNPQTHYCHCPITQPRDCELKYREKVIKYQAEIDRLTGELSRYKQGVEVEDFVNRYGVLQAEFELRPDLWGKRVRVLVMKVEE